MLVALGKAPHECRVLALVGRSADEIDFYPNFFVVQGAITYRPEPTSTDEVALLLGSEGEHVTGAVVVGYLVMPSRCDTRLPMEVFWNDRSLEATFEPGR